MAKYLSEFNSEIIDKWNVFKIFIVYLKFYLINNYYV